MRKQTDETYEQWLERVQKYEYELALEKISKGVPVDEVMERMSRNITQKMLHPIFVELRNIPVDEAAFALSKKQYADYYIKKVPRAADHIDD